MRVPIPEVFDPFYRGWSAYEAGGVMAVEQKEAPLLMYAADIVDPELADRLAAKYHGEGLQAADLRFGVWPDASPVPVRGEGDPVGVHLNTFGGRQVRYGAATEVERHVLDVLTHQTEELVREAISPAFGAAVFQFGKIPTMHKHVVARKQELDGLSNWKERALVDLAARREMRARLETHATPERMQDIAVRLGGALALFAA